MSEERTFSAKQVATRIGTDAKQLRKFLRDENSTYNAVGQGGRYDFKESELPLIAKAFADWSSTKTRRNRPARTTSAAGATPTLPRPRRSKQSLYDRTLGTDGPLEGRTGIPERMAKHGLMRDPNGRIVEQPEEVRGQLTAAEVMNPYKAIDRAKIPGFQKPATGETRTIMSNEEVLEYDRMSRAPHGEEQPIIDYLETRGDDEYDPSDYDELELVED